MAADDSGVQSRMPGQGRSAFHGGPSLASIVERLARLPGRRLTTTALLLMVVIGVVDYVTGKDVSIAVGYLLPVFVAATAGRRASTTFAGLAASAWTLIEVIPHGPYTHALIPFWNLIARFIVLWVIGALVSHLSARLAEERDLSRTDALTGLPNARAFREATGEEIERMRHSGDPLTAAYLDVDGFKAVNDAHGHAAGDAILATVGRVMSDVLHPADRVARLGGDEFALLMPGTGLDEAMDRLRRLHAALLEATATDSPRVGFSVGAVAFLDPPASGERLVTLADRIMYEAKRNGRNTLLGEQAEAVHATEAA